MPEIFGEPMRIAGFSGCGKGDDPEPSGAPVNTQQASFAPLPPSEGDTVEANEGQWSSDTPITYTYQWQLDGADIVGATLKTLLILPEMAGLALRCVVTAVNAAGSAISATVSAVVAAAINYVARLDGATQHWQLSGGVTIPEGGNFKISAKGTPSRGGFYFAASSLGTTGRLAVSGSSRNVFFNSSNVGNLTIEDFVNLTDGSVKNISFSRIGTTAILTVDGVDLINNPNWSNEAVYIDSIGSKWGSSTSIPSFEGVLYDFTVQINGSLTNEIPLTNKSQGALQLATVGTINATMINYTEAVWEVIPDE